MAESRKLIISCDGAARGNPGPAGVGVIVQDARGKILQRLDKFIGHSTNNQAEYAALIMAIEEALKLSAEEVEFRLDSDLVAKQMRGEFRVRSVDLQPFHQKATQLLRGIPKYSISYVPRSLNQESDQMANKAIDGHTLL